MTHADDIPEPRVGATYKTYLGSQGCVTVVKVSRDRAGRWTRVLVGYGSGCMPVPPPDNPDAPLDQWILPVARQWVTRRRWERECPQLLRDAQGQPSHSEEPPEADPTPGHGGNR